MFASKACVVLVCVVACVLVSADAYKVIRCDNGLEDRAKIISVDVSACPNKTEPCKFARDDQEVSVRVEFEAVRPVGPTSTLNVFMSFDGQDYLPVRVGQACQYIGMKCPLESGQITAFKDYEQISSKWVKNRQVVVRYELYGKNDLDTILCVRFEADLVD